MIARGRALSSSSRPSSSAGAASRSVRGRVTHGRPPSRPGTISIVGDAVAVGDQRLAEGEVQVHRAGAAVERGPERAARELAQPAHAGRAGRVVVDLEVPLGGAAVELDLVDRLPGAEVAQLGRAVGGQHEQRDARLVGLDHRRRVVGRGGARRCTPARPGTRWPWPGRARRTRRSARRGGRWRAGAARAPGSAPAGSSASRAR